jgi:hypothetical protein
LSEGVRGNREAGIRLWCAPDFLTDTVAEVIVTDSPDAVADSPDEATLSADSPTSADSPDEETPPTQSAATQELWQEVRVDPVHVALPGGIVGYTLRAYRPAGEVTPTEVPDQDDDPFTARERALAEAETIDEAELTRAALAAGRADREGGEDSEGGEDRPENADAKEADEAEDSGQLDEYTEDEDAEVMDEEVPVFLSHRGRLLLFSTPQALVDFITSDAPHDMTQLDTWSTLVERVSPTDIVPNEDDRYELDLVVENLRGGHDAWDLPLLISAGELARDLAWGLRLTPVIRAMAPGSPLDDLDEALRVAAEGGLSSWFARRRLRRFGAQQTSLGWRTVIGKITDAVDWRD